MPDGDPPSFQTTREAVGSNDEMQWGGSDGKARSDAIDTSTGVTVTDNGAVQTGSDIPDSERFEHNDLTKIYGGDTGSFTIQSSTVFEGNYAVRSSETQTGTSSSGILQTISTSMISASIFKHSSRRVP